MKLILYKLLVKENIQKNIIRKEGQKKKMKLKTISSATIFNVMIVTNSSHT